MHQPEKTFPEKFERFGHAQDPDAVSPFFGTLADDEHTRSHWGYGARKKNENHSRLDETKVCSSEKKEDTKR
jgi:hypothetical protein